MTPNPLRRLAASTVVVIAASVAPLFVAAPARAAAPPPPAVSACGSFGMNPGQPLDDQTGVVGLTLDYAKQIAATGATYVRLDFIRKAGASQVDLAVYDKILDDLATAGLRPLGLLGPGLVTGDQAQWNASPDPTTGANAMADAFVAEASRIIAHFYARSVTWEIWNEPNAWTKCSPLEDAACDPGASGATYVRPEVLANILFRLNPSTDGTGATYLNQLVVGGLLGHDADPGDGSKGFTYLDAFYDAVARIGPALNATTTTPWSGFGYHPYLDDGRDVPSCASDYVARLDELAARRAQHGDTSQAWLTEVGWSSKPQDGLTDADAQAQRLALQDKQASNVTKVMSTLTARPDVATAFLFKFQDSPGLEYGVLNLDGTKKASYQALVTSMGQHCGDQSWGCDGLTMGPLQSTEEVDEPVGAAPGDGASGEPSGGATGAGGEGEGDGGGDGGSGCAVAATSRTTEADSFGALLGIAVVAMVQRRRRKRYAARPVR